MGIERNLSFWKLRLASAGVILTTGGQRVSAQETQSNSNNHIQVEAGCRWHPLISGYSGLLIATRPFWHIDLEIYVKNIPAESEGLLVLSSENEQKIGILFKGGEAADFNLILHHYMGPMTPGQTPPPRFRENELYKAILYLNQKEMDRVNFATPECRYPSSGLLA